MEKRPTILVMGASGMLGHVVFRHLALNAQFRVVGFVRSGRAASLLPKALHESIVCGTDAQSADDLLALFAKVRPDVVINCIGLVKQLAAADEPLSAIPVNSILPHRLLRVCEVAAARLVHISTDCVFSGKKGMYREEDEADAHDLYGRSKLLGEVNHPQAVTLRTSIIGPELDTAHGLVGWFLAQRGRIRGFTRAIFSGLPTIELARVISDFVFPRAELHGVYHVSADPISKFDLLNLIARVYGVSVEIEPHGEVAIDRSLDSSRFRQQTGYTAPPWPELVRAMHEFG